MAISTADYVLDGSLKALAEGTAMHLCATQPTTFAQASSTKSLGSVALTPGDGGGDFTIADAGTAGRKVTVAAQSISVTSGGTGDHIAIVDTANTRLLHVTTTTSRAVLSGDTYNAAAFAWTNTDAV